MGFGFPGHCAVFRLDFIGTVPKFFSHLIDYLPENKIIVLENEIDGSHVLA